MTPKEAQRLAALIARRLFTNGSRERAQRLVLTVDSPQVRDLGGWCELAAIDQIADILQAELPEKAQR